MLNILHLSHTNIHTDSRILKSGYAATLKKNTVFYIGIAPPQRLSHIRNSNISSITLHSRKFKFLPKSLRLTLSFLEGSFKMFLGIMKIKPDIIHCNDVITLPVACLGKVLTKCKLIYDAHELESNKNGTTKTFGAAILLTEKVAWKFIDGLITVSPSIENWYQHTIGKKPSAVVLNSPTTKIEKIQKKSDYLRTYFNIPNNLKIFIYTGLLTKGRGIDLILDVFQASSIKSHIVFMGHGDLANEIQHISRTKENIHIHQAVPHDEVVSIVKSADAGLCLIQNISLSDYYCLPNKLFEYCFSGIPVIASNFPDIANLVYRYKIGICVDLNRASILEGVRNFENNDNPEPFSQNSLAQLNWTQQEFHILDLYTKVIE